MHYAAALPYGHTFFNFPAYIRAYLKSEHYMQDIALHSPLPAPFDIYNQRRERKRDLEG